MATAHLSPSPLVHSPAMDALHALWTRPISVGTALLTGLGIYAVGFILHDMYTYYLKLPLDMRGTLSARPHFYIRAGAIRMYRWLRGLDGTSGTGIRRWVSMNEGSEEMYGRQFLGMHDVPMRREPRATLLNGGIPQRQVPQVLDGKLEEARLSSASPPYYFGLIPTQNFKSAFRTYASSHALSCAPSNVEPNAHALFLPPTLRPHSSFSRREII